MALLLTIVLAGLATMLLVALVNAFAFRALPRASLDAALPTLSVLIPARNEEANIERCLASILAQDYPGVEVLLLDDASTDGTRAIVERLAASDPRLRCIPGAPLPEGWTGKNHACHQLAQEARGDLLLFTDADTKYEQGSLQRLAAEAQRDRADLLSLIPDQRMASFWERVFMPMLQFVTMCYLPFPLLARARSSSLAMANGQCMLFRRSAYDRVGGHATFRASLVEDVWLARAVKREGLRLRVHDGAGAVSCRMYDSLDAIREGFSKNLFPGLNASMPLAAGVFLWSFASGVLPFLLLPAGALSVVRESDWYTHAVLASLLMLAIRLLLALRFRQPLFSVLLHPLAQLLFLHILAVSAFRFRSGRGTAWKGRTYGAAAESSPVASASGLPPSSPLQSS